jgi:hypothetical protein
MPVEGSWFQFSDPRGIIQQRREVCNRVRSEQAAGVRNGTATKLSIFDASIGPESETLRLTLRRGKADQKGAMSDPAALPCCVSERR